MRRIEKAVVLTPEHVEIQLTPAGMGRRFLAWLLDFVIEVVAIAVLSVGLAIGLALVPGVAMAAISTVSFLVLWGYPIWFELRADGRTIGKRAMGIRVVDRRGLPLTFLQSFVRNIARAVDMLPLGYGVGAISCLADRHHRRLGDLIADTLVIVDDQPLSAIGRLAIRDGAASLQTPRMRQRIRNRIGLPEREFLLALCLRADRMERTARYDLMEAAGNHFRERLGMDDAHLSGEKLVTGLAAVLFARDEA